MLILTRRPAEVIRIGEGIKITFLGIKGNQVRIGIDAPRDVAVHREEVYKRIRAEEGGSTSRSSAQPMSVRIVPAGGEVPEKYSESHHWPDESSRP